MTHFIENGRVIDPLRRIDAKLNLLLENGKIACLTREKLPADEITDASGLVVCPGFIDLHGHEDPVKDGVRYADEQRANLACLLRMGVTTCLAGNCGDNFCDPSEFLDLIDREGCFVNVAMLAGYTYFRDRLSSATHYEPASSAERKRIAAALRKALEAGCAGISFGLEYVPGMSGEELREAARVCAPSGKLIAAHIRFCAEKAPEAAAEILETGREESVPVQISHIGSMAGYGQMEEFLNLVDSYRAGGMDACCDCYPYSAFSTTIGSAPYDDLEAIHCSYEDIELCEQYLENPSDEQSGIELYVKITSRYDRVIDGLGNGLYQYYRDEHFYDPEISGETLLLNMQMLHGKMVSYQATHFPPPSSHMGGQRPKMLYDVFISHANADKIEYVDQLKESIDKLRIKVFYDKDSLEWGDNWKTKILEGVGQAEFAIIVISENFFGREWTEKELREFLSRQNTNGQKIILPILHNITTAQLKEEYPAVADIQALNSADYSCDEIALKFAGQLIKRLKS